MPVAKTFQTAAGDRIGAAPLGGMERSLEVQFEFLQGEPEVGDRGVAPEVFERGPGLGPNRSADGGALAIGP